MTIEKSSTTSLWIDENIYLCDNLSNDGKSFFRNLWQWSLWHAWTYSVNLIRILSAYTPLCMDPKKKVECLYCDLCTPCKKPWSCMIIFSMTTYQKKKKKFNGKFMNIWHCLFLQNLKQLITETFLKKLAATEGSIN